VFIDALGQDLQRVCKLWPFAHDGRFAFVNGFFAAIKLQQAHMAKARRDMNVRWVARKA
jgi:hypothetical protein